MKGEWRVTREQTAIWTETRAEQGGNKPEDRTAAALAGKTALQGTGRFPL